MRAGACALQQTLTPEAASVLKHSLGLARRRGHAQVTPLHVAATLLSSRLSLLRRACLKSHPHSTSHPLQCRALELCFNVALNRLPTTPGPLLHSQPSLSNALIAALKRAQAHQRRGCIEQQQQQPLLAIKVELEQLIISILDDPSVSRVMREAGFSSTSVKNNLEDSSASSSLFYSSSGLLSSSCVETQRELISPNSFWQNPLIFPTQKKQNPATLVTDSPGESKEDLKLVFEVLVRKKRRNTVILGDCLSTTGSLMSQVMEKLERGDVPEELKFVRFINFNLSSLCMRFMTRDDVETQMSDLRRNVSAVVSVGGAIIYVGDLKWVVDEGSFENNYNPCDHMIVALGKLMTDFSSFSAKVWLMGIANYQTYIKCQMRTPSLEMQWALQAVAVPSGGLGLSLHPSNGLGSTISSAQSPQLSESKPFSSKDEQDKLVCCDECTSNYEKEASGSLRLSQLRPSSLSSSFDEEVQKGSNRLPYWLQPYRRDRHHSDGLVHLKQKWNRLCQSLHPHRRQVERHLNQGSYPPTHPWGLPTLHFTQKSNSNSIPFLEPSLFHLKHQDLNQPSSLNLDSLKPTENKEDKITLALGNSLFSEKDQEELRVKISRALQANLPWQLDSVPLISEALLDHKENGRQGSWLVIEGSDSAGKRRLALAIAESVFGSVERLVQINIKRATGESCTRALTDTLRKSTSHVILIEELDYAEPDFIKLLARGKEGGKLEDPCGRELSLGQAIIIVSKRSFANFSEEEEERPHRIIQMKLVQEETMDTHGAQSKRKADWGITVNKLKYPKSGDEGEFPTSRQSSFNGTLDLNVSAEGEPDESDSDLTQEAATNCHASEEFVESVKERFILDRSASRIDHARETFRSKIASAAEEIGENQLVIEGRVLEELVNASAFFLDSFFEKWLNDVFQTSWATVKDGGKGGRVKLCLGGREEDVSGFGFFGSCLPNRIQLPM